MNFNENLIPFSQKEDINNEKELEINNNIKNNNNNPQTQFTKINKLNFQNEEKEIDDIDGIDDLRYKDDIQNNINPCLKQRLDSCDSCPNYKYSIDIPNVSRGRLHEYLNEDLLNALDTDPNTTNLNNGIYNNGKIYISNECNEPNRLLDSSLNSQQNSIINNLNINKNNNKNDINNFSEINNNNSNNNFRTNNNINNLPLYIPIKYRKKEINDKNNHENKNEENNQNINKEEDKKIKISKRNKFGNPKKKNKK